MELHQVEAVAPGLAARIAGAEPGHARTFAFRVARLACAVAGVHDQQALDVAREGLERYPEIDELVHLWELERELDAACESKLGSAPSTVTLDELQLTSECVEARAVAAVIAALSPDARDAARGATYEALTAGCDGRELEAIADQVLDPSADAEGADSLESADNADDADSADSTGASSASERPSQD